jgi:hypothetical protein
MLVLREHCARFIEEDASSISQLNAARLAVKELHIEFAFDRLDPLTEWRLLHAELLGSARDVPFLGDRDEIAEVPEFHCHIQYDMNFAASRL